MTNETPEREGGAWIGQHPDENTQKLRDNLADGAERVAETNNESGPSPVEGDPPRGHRDGDDDHSS